MSSTIDERIVMMKFDNKDFERNAQTSLTTLEKLKQKLNFSDVQTKLGAIDTSALKKSIDNIGDIDSSKINGVLDRLEYRMSNFGIFTARIVENVADSMYSMVQKALDGVERIVTYAEQGIVQGGYTRASNIQSAKFQLEGLGIAWGDIYSDIDYAVTNTAYALDQAAIVASRLASSGIKPGETWKNAKGETQDIDTMAMVLRGISGTAAATGGKAGYAEIGNIFTKMISYGKVNLQQLNELGTYGIGATGILAEYFNKIGYKGKTGWKESDIREITGSRNETLDPMLVIEAMFDKFGEHATAANETLSGVMANTKSALARIGENFFEPIIENGGPLVHAFEILRQSINDVNRAIKPVVRLFGENVAAQIQKFVDAFMVEEIDEEGNKSYKLKTVGGIFSGWLQPWKSMEYVKNNLPEGIHPTDQIPEGYWVTYESRIERVVNNIRIIFWNLFETVKNIGSGIGKVISDLTPGFKGWEDLLVRITNKLVSVTTAIKNFTSDPGFKDSLFFKLIRAIGAGIDIIIRFGKSFKLHIIDPIFNKAASAAKASGLTTWFRDLLDRIFEFDMMLKQKGNEDYFGPMLENMKARLKEMKDNIADALQSIKDWWRPVKDIIFNTDLSWGDKFDSIKAYFSENFELPGWEKAKNLFEKIGDAIGKVKDKIKDFFGFGGKEEQSTVELQTMSSGLTTMGAAGEGAVPFVSKLKPTIDVTKEGVDTLDTTTSKLSSIGEKIGSFFSSIKDAFTNIDVDGLKLVGIAIVAVFVLLAVGIAWTIKKIFDTFNNYVLKFPELMSKILESFNTLLTSLSGMFKAKKFESYTAGLKNMAQAAAIIVGIVLIAGLITGLIHKFGGPEMIDGLREAELIVGVAVGILSGLIITITALTKNATGTGVALSKADGLKASFGSSSFAGIAAFLKSLAIALGVIVGSIIILGLIPTDVLDRGTEAVGDIAYSLGILVGAILLLDFLLSLTPVNDKAFVGSLASIGAVLTGFAVAMAIIVPSIVILGLIPRPIINRGVDTLTDLMWTMVAIVSVLMVISAVMSFAAGVKGKDLALTILSLAAVITSVAIGVAAMAAGMYLLSRLDGWSLAKGVVSLIAISAMLVAIPTALMAVFSTLGKQNLLFGEDMSSGKAFTSIAATILAVAGAVLGIAIAFRVLDKVKNLGANFGVVIGLVAGITGMVVVLSKIKEEDLRNVGKTMLVMGGVFVAVGAMLAVLTMFDFADLAASAGVMLMAIAVLAIAIYALNKELVSTDKNAYKNLSDFSKSMLMVSAALLPLAGALVLILGVVGSLNVDPLSTATTLAGFVLVILALAAATNWIAESAGQSKAKKGNIEAYTKAIMKMSLALIPIAVAAAAMLAVLGATGISGWTALGLLTGLGIVIFAMGTALGLMIEGVAQVKNENMIKASAALILSMSLALMGIGAAVGLAIFAVTASGIDAGRLAIVGVILGAMMVFVGLMSTFMIKAIQSMRWNKGSSAKKVLTVLGTYATVCAGLFAMAGALKLVATANKESIVRAGIILGVMAGVVTVITIVLTRMNSIPTASLTTMVTFLGVCAGLVVIAKALQMLSTFQFAAIRDNLMAMGAVVLVALAITALFGIFATLNTSAALATAGMLLGLGVTMAGVGIMLYLFAEALDTFLDTMIEVDGKADQIKGGVGAALTGFLEGLYEGLVKLNELIGPKILPELTKLFDSIFGWLEDEIPRRFESVLNILKAAIISLSDFINDPEVQAGVVGIVDGILQLLLDNAESWTSKVVQIGVKIGAGICDGINQAFFGGELTGFDDFLMRVGEAIDKNLLGGSLGNFANALGSGIEADAFTKAWDDSYQQLMIAATKIAKNLGYTEEQMREALMRKSKDGYRGETILDAAINAILGAEYYGNEDYAKIIEEHGGVVQYLSAAVEEIMKNASMGKLVSSFEMGNTFAKAFPVIDSLNAMADTLLEETGTSGFIGQKLSNAASNIQQALYEGWDTSKGQYFRTIAALEIQAAIDATDDPEKKAELYEKAKELGLELPKGFEKGVNEKPTKTTINTWLINKVGMPILSMMKFVENLGTLSGSWLINAFNSQLQTGQSTASLGFKVFIPELNKQIQADSEKGIVETGNSLFGASGFANATLGKGFAGLFSNTLIPAMTTGSNSMWAVMQGTLTALAMIPTTLRPSINLVPSVSVTNTSIPEGTLNTIAGVFKVKLQNAFGAGNFTYTGEMVTSGILGGMINASSVKKMSSTANSFILSLAKAICKRFAIASPAKAPEVTEPGEYIGAGFLNSIVGYFKKNVDNSADDMAGDTQEALNQSFNDVDLSSVGTTLSDSLTSKMPSWDSLKSNFGWEKGISGNIQGVKNAWNQIKSAFQDENGNFDLGSMFGGVGDSLSSVLSGITNSLNLSDFDLQSMGFNYTIDGGFDFSNFNSEFETFDMNDALGGSKIEAVLDVDTTMFDDWLQENTTLDMATSAPMGGGYQRDTLGSTYVNNYTYNQTNNSPTALSSREIRRQTELELMRSRNGSRFRTV